MQNFASDARSRIVSITPSGRDKHQQADIQWCTAQQRAVDVLGLEHYFALNLLLDECNSMLI